MFKKLGFQKGLKNINIDSESHIIYKKTKMSLVVLRPNDLAQMGDLIGQGNKEIIMWIGRTVGRRIAEIVEKEEGPRDHNDFIVKGCKLLEELGFGVISVEDYSEGASVKVRVDNTIYENIDENQDIISMIYMGILSGLVEYLGYTCSIVESSAAWKNKELGYSMFDLALSVAGAAE